MMKDNMGLGSMTRLAQVIVLIAGLYAFAETLTAPRNYIYYGEPHE